MRYISRMMKNLILVRALEVKGLRETLGESILKMSSGSLVVLKTIRCNNIYYLMDIAVTELTSSNQLMAILSDYGTNGFEQVALKSDQALEGASTYHLESCDSCVLGKKKEKFSTVTHHLHVHVDVWGPTKTVSLGGHQYFVSIVNNYSRNCWVYPIRQRVKVLKLLMK